MNVERLIELYEMGHRDKQIADDLEITEKAVNSKIYRLKKAGEIGERGAKLPLSYIEHRQDGSVCVSRLLAITEEDAKSPSRVVELCGFDPKLWDVIRCKVNDWNMLSKYDGQIINHQVKIDLKPKQEVGLSFDDIDEYFEKKKGFHSSVKVKRGKLGGRRLAIELADLHIGSNDFGVVERAKMVIEDIILETKHLDIELIYLVPLGDTLHYDTAKKTTTGGTVLEYGMTPPDMWDAGADLMIWIIDRLASIAPVELIGIYGNHDRVLSYTLFRGLQMWYRNTKGILIDTEKKYAKYREFGKCLCVWHHADMNKKRLENLVLIEAREAFGRTKYSELHGAHEHHEKTKDLGNGIIIRHNPTIASPSEWEVLMGYAGLRSSIAYAWDAERGIKGMFPTNL